MDERVKGVIFRSKSHWIEEGKKYKIFLWAGACQVYTMPKYAEH